VSEPWHPSIEDITYGLTDLADRLSKSGATSVDPYVFRAVRDIASHLEYHIPGLDVPPDPESAEALARAAQMALDRGDEREALSRALRGLAFSPHDPTLFYLAASACFELGAIELAIRLLYHTLWIHPGHRAARAELESLTAFLDDAEEDRAA
jgi:hypothetical protein